MSKRRVGYVLKRYPRLSETFILNEILAHEGAGLDLHIISLRLPEEQTRHEDVARVRAGVSYLPDEPVSVRDFGAGMVRAAEVLDADELTQSFQDSKPLWSIWQASQVARIAEARGITHLHAHFATEATAVARMASRIAGISYTFTAHAKDIFHESVQEAQLRRFARDAAGLVTVSEFNVAHLRGVLGDEACPIHRIYNGLDLAEFPCSEGPRDPSLIVAVGRLVEKKGFDDLVRACRILKQAGRDIRCVIVGDGEEQARLARLIESEGVSAQVEMTGARPRADVKAIMSRASVLAAPCVVGEDGNRDGLPTVILEAMALGTPCVSTPVTGIPEVVRQGETGLLVPERDPAALAGAIAEVLDDPARGRRMARAARALIEQSFDLHRNTRAQRELFSAAAMTGAA